ncbi:hypothetical protein ACFLU6_07295 [Acidobacteriota bacterium]
MNDRTEPTPPARAEAPRREPPRDSARRKQSRQKPGPGRAGKRNSSYRSQPRSSKKKGVQVVVSGNDVQVADIMAAIRMRIRKRKLSLDGSYHEQVREQIEKVERSAGVFAGVPQAELNAMLEGIAGWNVDKPFPITSHRPVIGTVFVTVKKALRFFSGILAKPLLTQQAEINRRQLALTREVIREMARQNIELKSTITRLEAVLRRTGIESDSNEPLVVFENGDREGKFRHKRPRPRPRHPRPRGPKSGHGTPSGGQP